MYYQLKVQPNYILQMSFVYGNIKKTVNQFLSYLISIGEYHEEYEACSKLIIQQKKYNKWINTNLEIVENISKLLTGLSNRKI